LSFIICVIAAEEDDEESSMMAVLMPPHIEQTGKLLRIRALEVDQLPQMDDGVFGSKCDPYVKVEFAGLTMKTDHKTVCDSTPFDDVSTMTSSLAPCYLQ
jgi:hypothetical protein